MRIMTVGTLAKAVSCVEDAMCMTEIKVYLLGILYTED